MDSQSQDSHPLMDGLLYGWILSLKILTLLWMDSLSQDSHPPVDGFLVVRNLLARQNTCIEQQHK